MSRIPLEKLTAALLLAAIALLSVNLKLRLSLAQPRYDAQDELGYFRSESAMQLRYARMVAQGRNIPELDRDAQYPEGAHPRREQALLMEYATGLCLRLLEALGLPAPSLRWFVLVWAAAASSLSILALYFLSYSLSRSRAVSLAAAAAYALSWAGLSNLIGSYRLESLALPLIHLSLAALCGALDPAETRFKRHAAVSGLCMAMALGSWHFAPFYWASFLAAYACVYWRRRREPEARRRLRFSLTCQLGSAAAAGLMFPSLRHALAGRHGSFGHVYALLFEKLRHGLVKPLDPAALSPEARLLWTGPFNSPEPGFLVFCLLPFAFMLLPRLLALLKREKSEPPSPAEMLIDALLILYGLGTVLVSRLLPFAVFLLPAAALRLPGRRRQSAGLAAFFAFVALAEGFKAAAPASPLNPFMRLSASLSREESQPGLSWNNEKDLLDWLKARKGAEPVLASYGLSASILAYAEKPVLLQPKFEAPEIRAKTMEFLKALYSGEEEFAAYCKKYQAALFVYGADMILDETPDGPRYASGSMGLKPDTAAVLFHFHPERLKHFRLLSQNEDFRVYEAGRGSAETPAPAPIYDISYYNPRVAPDGALKLDVAGVLRRRRARELKLFLARVLVRLGRRREALRLYEEASAAWPR
ncbi:MAG: hypothetical protein HY921_11600 [Elusimicrobia bacterium]|nr:hypothetical protein [Elusimicrobiota bacterium]